MHRTYFMDGIREGDYEDVDELENPWLQIKGTDAQLYYLQDDPRIELVEYRYSIFKKASFSA